MTDLDASLVRIYFNIDDSHTWDYLWKLSTGTVGVGSILRVLAAEGDEQQISRMGVRFDTSDLPENPATVELLVKAKSAYRYCGIRKCEFDAITDASNYAKVKTGDVIGEIVQLPSMTEYAFDLSSVFERSETFDLGIQSGPDWDYDGDPENTPGDADYEFELVEFYPKLRWTAAGKTTVIVNVM